MPPIHTDRLPALLRTVCGDRPDREAVREAVELARQLAAAYLRVRRLRYSGPIRAMSHGDLALDLVADLFRRDERGRFTELRIYFDPVPESGAECLSAYRRLVCSRVSQGLFERNRRLDPELARIIRNVKLGARRLGYDVEERHGSKWLVFGEPAWDLPLAPPEILEARLIGALRDGTTLDDVLHTIAADLAERVLYRSAVPVVMAAQIIRSAWIRLEAGGDGVAEPAEPAGLSVLVDHAVDVVRATLRASYLKSGKLPADLFESYLRVAKSWVAAELIADGPRLSLYERLTTELPGLDRECFTTEHRARLEYISRLVRERLILDARAEFSDEPTDAE